MPRNADLVPDALAAIPRAVASVPDGMAASVLAGVDPIYGLYASMVGPILGGLFSSSALMVVTATSASALAASSALTATPSADRASALFLLTLMAGGVMLVAGILRLGRYTRFVANSVMLGFLSGIAVNILLSQVPGITGAEAAGANATQKALDVLLHPGRIDPATVLVGLSTIALLVWGSRTRVRAFAALAALAIPSIVVAVAGLTSVVTVGDQGAIPTGLPIPAIPPLRLFNLDLLFGAGAIAVIVLVQSAGVADSVPNPDGTRADLNRNFVAQAIANAGAGLFSGQPVGGSVGQTALNRSIGARSRWAAVFSGLWMGVILLLFSTLVGEVAVAALAGVLIVAAIGALNEDAILLVWRTGPISQIAMVTTFVATLFLPVAAAVGIGVALSLLLQLNQEAMDLTVVRMVPRDDGTIVVEPAPKRLGSREVVMLDVFGSLLFAGARTLEAHLPDPGGAKRPAVVLRLRGRTTLSSTATEVLARYVGQLEEAGGRLYLSGVDPGVAEHLRRTHNLEAIGSVELVPATDVLGESSRDAYARARAFVAEPS
ncbi:MAG: SulP family inorganic anion transporter [Actinomycetota bacterium]